ncbi:hypothetical protein EON67_09410 [archaeon]|nr:MAG: hypothetical protein EON67_09410 [archaeon]
MRRHPVCHVSTVTCVTLDCAAWMTPDLMARVAKEPALMAAMSNPRFMTALAEMQSNPKAAMDKYKVRAAVDTRRVVHMFRAARLQAHTVRALRRYFFVQDDKPLQEMLRRFMGIMGEHFMKLAEQQQAASASHAHHAGRDAATAATHEGTSAGADGRTSKALLEPAPAPGASLITASARPTGGALIREVGTASKPASSPAATASATAAAADPEVQRVLANPQLMSLLQDPEIRTVLEALRRAPHRFREFMTNPTLREKLTIMQRAGLLRFEA